MTSRTPSPAESPKLHDNPIGGWGIDQLHPGAILDSMGTAEVVVAQSPTANLSRFGDCDAAPGILNDGSALLMVTELARNVYWTSQDPAVAAALQEIIAGTGGSTDMGNVSHVVPSIHGMVAVLGSDAVPHNPAFTAAAASPQGDQAVLDGATLVAWTVIDAALTLKTRSDLQRRRQERPAGATRVTLHA